MNTEYRGKKIKDIIHVSRTEEHELPDRRGHRCPAQWMKRTMRYIILKIQNTRDTKKGLKERWGNTDQGQSPGSQHQTLNSNAGSQKRQHTNVSKLQGKVISNLELNTQPNWPQSIRDEIQTFPNMQNFNNLLPMYPFLRRIHELGHPQERCEGKTQDDNCDRLREQPVHLWNKGKEDDSKGKKRKMSKILKNVFYLCKN